ncbi:putative reverse transcriptase domain-containing protein [Tanacetum coccineum]
MSPKDEEELARGACYECGNTGHIKKNCPKLKNYGNGNGNGTAQGRAYALRGRDASPDSKTSSTGTFLLNNRYARILFDTGVDRSFVSNTFSALINITPTMLETHYDVDLADGKIIEVNTIIIMVAQLKLHETNPFNIDFDVGPLGSHRKSIRNDSEGRADVSETSEVFPEDLVGSMRHEILSCLLHPQSPTTQLSNTDFEQGESFRELIRICLMEVLPRVIYTDSMDSPMQPVIPTISGLCSTPEHPAVSRLLPRPEHNHLLHLSEVPYKPEPEYRLPPSISAIHAEASLEDQSLYLLIASTYQPYQPGYVVGPSDLEEDPRGGSY